MASYTGSDKRLAYLFQNGGGGGSSTLAGLSDVDLDNLTDGQIIKWDGTEQKWVNANESGGGGGGGEIYSTAERVIGEWDGKPLYRRILPQAQITSGAVTYTHNIGIKYYINIGGTCTVNGQTANTFPFPFYQNRWSGYCGIQACTPNSITFDSNWSNDTINCFIEYTKEADYSS